VAGDCAATAAGDIAKDLTGISTLNDIVDAAATGSIRPLVSGENALDNGLDVVEKTGELASKVLTGTPGKVMGIVGKRAGQFGTVLSVVKAGAGMKSCMGW
jgi:hypothetical protein